MGAEASRLGLGLAWLGHGGGERATAEAFATVALAADAGVRLVDVPSAPGAACAILGEVLPREPAFRTVLRLVEVEKPESLAGAIRDALHRLGRPARDVAVVVRAAAVADQPQLWDGLRRLKDEGAVAAVGVAACVCDGPAALARRLRPDLMQLPLGLFDQRLVACGALDAIAEQGVEVHLRTPPAPRLTAGDEASTPEAARLASLLSEAGADLAEAGLAFALSRPEASAVVVGVRGASDLRSVLRRAAVASRLDLDWPALRSDAGCAAAPERCIAA